MPIIIIIIDIIKSLRFVRLSISRRGFVESPNRKSPIFFPLYISGVTVSKISKLSKDNIRNEEYLEKIIKKNKYRSKLKSKEEKVETFKRKKNKWKKRYRDLRLTTKKMERKRSQDQIERSRNPENDKIVTDSWGNAIYF